MSYKIINLYLDLACQSLSQLLQQDRWLESGTSYTKSITNTVFCLFDRSPDKINGWIAGSRQRFSWIKYLSEDVDILFLVGSLQQPIQKGGTDNSLYLSFKARSPKFVFEVRQRISAVDAHVGTAEACRVRHQHNISSTQDFINTRFHQHEILSTQDSFFLSLTRDFINTRVSPKRNFINTSQFHLN
jgi:hypothetical protein